MLEAKSYPTVRWIFADQINDELAWLDNNDENILYVIAEISSQTLYGAPIETTMNFDIRDTRAFANVLETEGHHTLLLKLSEVRFYAGIHDLVVEISDWFDAKEIEFINTEDESELMKHHRKKA